MNFKSEIILSYFYQVGNVILGFVSIVLLTKILSPADWGYYTLFQNLVMMTSIIGSFGLASAVVYFVASSKIEKFRLVYNFILFQVLLSVVIVVLFYVINNYISKDLVKLNIPKFYLLFFLQLSFMMVNNIITGLMRGDFMFNKINFIVCFINIVTVGLYAIFYFFKPFEFDLNTVLYFLIFCSIAQFISTLFIYYVKDGKNLLTFSFLTRSEIKAVYKFILFVYIANVLQIFVYKIDTWILYKYFNSTLTGVYALAVTVAQTTWLFATAVSTILFSIASKETLENSKSILLTYIRIAFVVSIFIGVSLLVFLYFFSDLIFGKDYRQILYIIPILFVGIVPFSINIVAASFLAGLHKNHYNLIGSLLSFIVVLILDFILIPHYGYWGASIATVFSYIVTTIYVLIILKTKFGITLSSIFGLQYFMDDFQKGKEFIMSKLKTKKI